jgi:hypothetical protein
VKHTVARKLRANGEMSFGQEWWKKFHEPQLACENHKIEVLANFCCVV